MADNTSGQARRQKGDPLDVSTLRARVHALEIKTDLGNKVRIVSIPGGTGDGFFLDVNGKRVCAPGGGRRIFRLEQDVIAIGEQVHLYWGKQTKVFTVSSMRVIWKRGPTQGKS